MSAREARKLAETSDGTYFEPVRDDVEDALEDARIRWIEGGDVVVVTGTDAAHEALADLLG